VIDLKGRTIHKIVEGQTGSSLLEIALANNIDWGFSCTRGTCARCRCYISEGMECLSESSAAEKNRLEPEEIDQGYRLGCQAVLIKNEKVSAQNKTYF
jgi:2Fe-2S ferredoxin